MAPRKKTPGREAAFVEHPDDLAKPEAQKDLADSVADGVIAHVNAQRAKAGKPPLPKE